MVYCSRELGERWGQNPIAGGGYTMKLDAMKYAVLEKVHIPGGSCALYFFVVSPAFDSAM